MQLSPLSLRITLLFFLVFALQGFQEPGTRWVDAAISCMTSNDCESLIGEGSVCDEKLQVCSNPIQIGGCLAYHGLSEQQRVCNSDDPPILRGVICREPDFDYLELRLFGGNWDSIAYATWLLQILFNEILGVPATVEAGRPHQGKLNLYDPMNDLDFGSSQKQSAMELASRIGDCRLTDQSCAHFTAEVWDAEVPWTTSRVFDGTLEPPQGLGMLGEESWFVPKFTIEKDPTLSSYIGLQGEENRQKLADTFLRPTTWGDYCTQVSPSMCTSSDSTAKRAPDDEEEAKRYFVEGDYTGYFRATRENNCTLHPNTCTGHIADYPCGWTSYVEAQTYHLGIALKSNGPEPGANGYGYGALTEIWKAASATKNNVVLPWWSPEPLYQAFMGTDAEFHKVFLPPPTQECLEARVSLDDLCSENPMDRVGAPAGVCTEPARPLQKLIVGNLIDLINDPDIPDGARSPGHEVLRLFLLSEHQLGELFDYVRRMPSPRMAVCQWAADHVDYLRSFVPSTYPRAARDADNGWPSQANTVVGCLASFLVCMAGWFVYSKQRSSAIRLAQVEFLALLLAGSLMVALAAVVNAQQPTDATCSLTIFLMNIGYSLKLVPLIVKIAAINRLVLAARRLKRLTLHRSHLFGVVFVISSFVVLFLIFWVALDPPHAKAEYALTEATTSEGHFIVTSSYYCSSRSSAWQYVAVGWNGFLLLCASILAFQTRGIREDFNESRTLAFLIYSDFLFVIFRIVTFGLSGEVDESTLQQLRSAIFSLDTIASLLIYFIPKFAAKKQTQSNPIQSSIFMSPDDVCPMCGHAEGRARDESNALVETKTQLPPDSDDCESNSKTNLQANCIDGPEAARLNNATETAPTGFMPVRVEL